MPKTYKHPYVSPHVQMFLFAQLVASQEGLSSMKLVTVTHKSDNILCPLNVIPESYSFRNSTTGTTCIPFQFYEQSHCLLFDPEDETHCLASQRTIIFAVTDGETSNLTF
jgi:hypothetical protein